MKNEILRQLLRMSKYILYGVVLHSMLCTILIASDSRAQKSIDDVYISSSIEEAKLINIIERIERETDFSFSYDESLLKNNEELDLSISKGTLREVLTSIAIQADLRFRRVDENIYIVQSNSKKNRRRSDKLVEEPIQVLISGKVTEGDTGEPLPGVSIIIENTTTGTTTDIDGNYSLSAPEGSILQFSYIGFITKEVTVGTQTTINIALEPDSEQLEEVVVIGYGTAKVKNITGAVARVELEDSPISDSPTTNILQSLRGNMAGVNIGTQNAAGENPNLLVRGQNSINGSNAPLVVLDGIIFLGNIADINPADIADISVLKDASAAAAYGSRSANGVIMINTKKGKTDKPTIRYSATFGSNTWNNKPNLMNREKWAEKYALQRGFDSVEDIVMPDESTQLMLGQEDLDTDWLDLVSRRGFIQEHQVSVSGRTDRVNYFFSGGFSDQEGTIIGDDFQRISGRARLDVDVTDWLEVGIDGTYNRNDYSGMGANVGSAQTFSPSAAPFIYDDWPNNAASATSTELARWPRGQSIVNPLWNTNSKAVEDVDTNDFFRFAGNALFKVPGIEGLTYKLNYSVYTRVINQDRIFNENYYIQEHANPPFLDPYSPSRVATGLTSANGFNRDIRQNNYVVDNIINYNRDFGKHFIDATLVATRDFTSTKTAELEGRDFSTNGNTVLGVNGMAFAETQINSLDIVERSNIGYLGRVSYAYDNKYHFNASIRRDGASVFGEENKWGNFPSVGVAWTISEESFLQGSDIASYLKLSLSYGINGNQGVDPYGTLSRVASGPSGGIFYEFGDAPETLLFGIRQENLANPTLGWERTTSFNVGLQSIWLDGKISLDMNYYYSQTTDQIFNRQIPIMTGFNSIISSLGQVDNNGLEINLTGNIIEKDALQLTSGFNLWWNRNKVVSLYGDDLDGDGREDDDISNNLFIGEPLGAIFGYEAIGVVQEEDTDYLESNGGEPGDPKFNDLDGDGIITAQDRKILGFTDPNFRFGFSNTLSYKNLSLYVMIAGNLGGNGFYQQANPYATSFRDRFDTNELDHPWWTPENRSNEYLRPTFLGQRYLGLQSRGFVRIQDIILSYVLPSNLLNGIGVQSLKVNATVRNLYTFTGWDGGGDPEEGIPALSDIYPVPTVYSMGLNVSF